MSKVLSMPGKPGPGPTPGAAFSPIEEILAELKAGRMVIILDDEDRENEGDLIMAARARHPRGGRLHDPPHERDHLRTDDEEQLARLELPQMVRSTASHTAPPSPSRSTCASAPPPGCPLPTAPRPSAPWPIGLTPASDFARPGHIFPLRPRRGGVLVRAGHTEAAVDLCRLAGLKPAGVLCEIMNDDGTMARRPAAQEFARAAPAQDRHDRRSHPPSAADRALGRAPVRAERAHRIRRVPPVRLPGPRAHTEVHLALAHGRLDGRRRRWCACTSRTRCATCSACSGGRAPGRCARRCSASSRPATA